MKFAATVVAMLAAYVPAYAAQPTKPVPKSVASAPMLARIFTYDMLGADVAYLQQFTGVPRTTYGTSREYRVGGCKVSATINDGKVRNLGVDLSERCTFDLGAFNPSWKSPAHGLTFGQFENTVGKGVFLADCLSDCGNAYDPSVYEHYEGSHAENWVEVRLGVVLVDDAAITAADAWREPMQAAFGDDYVVSAKFNCEARFNNLASRAFSKVRVTRMDIGFDLEKPKCGA